jgi:hypothetical protein
LAQARKASFQFEPCDEGGLDAALVSSCLRRQTYILGTLKMFMALLECCWKGWKKSRSWSQAIYMAVAHLAGTDETELIRYQAPKIVGDALELLPVGKARYGYESSRTTANETLADVAAPLRVSACWITHILQLDGDFALFWVPMALLLT